MTEQEIYADWLDTGTRIGFIVLVGTFLTYTGGFATPYIAFADLPKYWGLPVDAYLAATGAPTGWGWLALAARGDFMNFTGVALLGAITMICYARVLPVLVGRRDYLYAAIAVAELLILGASASGLIGSGR